MWPFKDDTRTKLMDPDTYDKLLKRIVERDADLTALKSKMAAVELDIEHLRGKMRTKLQDLRKEFEAEQVTPNESYINSGEVPIG